MDLKFAGAEIMIPLLFLIISRGASALLPFNAEIYLPFEFISGSNAADGGSIPGEVASEGVTVVPGKVGQAFSFSGGAGNSFYLGNSRNSCFWSPALCTEGYTAALWIKFGTKTGDLFYITNGGQTFSSFGINLSLHGEGTMKYFIKDNDRHWMALCDDVTREVWNHVALTWDSVSGSKIYLNGVECDADDTGSASITPTTDENDFYFGLNSKTPTEAGKGEGIMDEYLFWPEKKSDLFMLDLYNSYSESRDLGKRQAVPGKVTILKHPGKRFVSGIGQLRSVRSEADCAKLCFINDVNCLLASWSPQEQTCRLSNTLVSNVLEDDTNGAFVLEKVTEIA